MPGEHKESERGARGAAMADVSSLDEQLAAFADDLLAGDRRDASPDRPESEPIESEPITPPRRHPERAAPALPEVVNDTSELTDVPPEDESAKKHKDAKEQLDPRETESQPKDASRHQAKPLDGTLDDPPARPAAAAQVESSLRARCGRLAVRALALMSAPLDRRPRIVRRIIGWLAIWTGVIALAAIIAVLTRSAQPPESDQSGSALEGGAAGSAR